MEDWDKVNAVHRMQEYIISHSNEEITMHTLAGISGYSLWHSIRIFKELSGKTPFEYIRAVRMTDAAKSLRDTGEKVIDIALSNGFDSHDGFTRAFSRQFNITPQKYREEKPPLSYFTYYPLLEYHLYMNERKDKVMEKSKISGTVTVTPVERPARRLILLYSKNATDYFSYCGEVGCDWEGMLNSVAEKFDNAALITLPKSLYKEGYSDIASGIEVPADYAKPIPKNYEIVDLPPCRMLYFQGMPFENDEDYGEAIGIIFEAIENYKPEQYGFISADDIAPRFNFGASAKTGARMSIPIK